MLLTSTRAVWAEAAETSAVAALIRLSEVPSLSKKPTLTLMVLPSSAATRM